MFTILWFGGHNTLGLALMLESTGGVVSTTVIIVEQDVELVALSVTVTATTLVPSGKTPEKETLTAPGGLLTGKVLVWRPAPLRVQTTVKPSPSGSDTKTVTCAMVAHSTVLAAGQLTVGGE